MAQYCPCSIQACAVHDNAPSVTRVGIAQSSAFALHYARHILPAANDGVRRNTPRRTQTVQICAHGNRRLCSRQVCKDCAVAAGRREEGREGCRGGPSWQRAKSNSLAQTRTLWRRLGRPVAQSRATRISRAALALARVSRLTSPTHRPSSPTHANETAGHHFDDGPHGAQREREGEGEQSSLSRQPPSGELARPSTYRARLRCAKAGAGREVSGQRSRCFCEC